MSIFGVDDLWLVSFRKLAFPWRRVNSNGFDLGWMLSRILASTARVVSRNGCLDNGSIENLEHDTKKSSITVGQNTWKHFNSGSHRTSQISPCKLSTLIVLLLDYNQSLFPTPTTLPLLRIPSSSGLINLLAFSISLPLHDPLPFALLLLLPMLCAFILIFMPPTSKDACQAKNNDKANDRDDENKQRPDP